VQALENEEVDIIQPQATADILTQLEALADRGVEVIADDGATYEHVDLVFNNGGPFDPATYGGDEATALAVRQAFLKTVPRQEIVERLIAPLNPDATVRDSFTTVPGAPGYDAIAAENGSADWQETDIEGAIALLEEHGVQTPIQVRFHYAANNPRRANQYELIRDSAAQAGFEVLDGNSPTWGQDLPNTSIYDASMFGWQSTTIDVAGTNSNFVTGGQNNYGGSSNPAIDELFATLESTTDPDEQQALLLQIEQELWAMGFGIPIYQHPSITGYNSTYVSGVSNVAIAPTVFWNFWEWQAA
jgi:peptide/nickel transport system substrate-binding protein